MVMNRINKIDSDGVKPLLGLGELGLDNYPAGNDVGRVYVGTGTENIPLAKIDDIAELAVTKDSDTGSAAIPSGTTAERTAVTIPGMLRFNTELNRMEMYDLDNWREVGGGQLLGTTDEKAIGYLANSTAEELVVKAGTNGFAVDNIEVLDGGSITVEDGAVFKVL